MFMLAINSLSISLSLAVNYALTLLELFFFALKYSVPCIYMFKIIELPRGFIRCIQSFEEMPLGHQYTGILQNIKSLLCQIKVSNT